MLKKIAQKKAASFSKLTANSLRKISY